MQGLLPEKKVFEVHVEQGHKHASKIVLRGEAGYSEPGVEPGDVIFVLEQKQHKVFRRIHSDLVYEKVGLADQQCTVVAACMATPVRLVQSTSELCPRYSQTFSTCFGLPM